MSLPVCVSVGLVYKIFPRFYISTCCQVTKEDIVKLAPVGLETCFCLSCFYKHVCMGDKCATEDAGMFVTICYMSAKGFHASL